MKIWMKICGELSTITGNSFIMLDEPGGSDLKYTVKFLVADDSGAPLKDYLLDENGECKTSVNVTIDGVVASWDDENILKDAMTAALTL